VGSFGEELRQAREAKHITLQEIAATTKISCRALQALEDEHFEQLPGGIFNKGFVRAYARYVGMDEEKTLAGYMASAKLESPDTDMQAMSSQVATARTGARDSAVNGTTVVGILALMVALGLGALWLREQRREAREAREERIAASNTPAPAVAAAPVAVAPAAASNAGDAGPGAGQNENQTAAQSTTPSATQSANQSATQSAGQNTGQSAGQSAEQAAKTAAGAVAPPAKAGAEQAAPVEVSISATQRSWISVRSDGKAVESVTLDPDKPEMRSRSYKAKEKLILMVGNPAGLTVTYNGKPAGSLGPVGQRETITFTPQGMEKQ
jgi:cytoskeleton protein RodZ